MGVKNVTKDQCLLSVPVSVSLRFIKVKKISRLQPGGHLSLSQSTQCFHWSIFSVCNTLLSLDGFPHIPIMAKIYENYKNKTDIKMFFINVNLPSIWVQLFSQSLNDKNFRDYRKTKLKKHYHAFPLSPSVCSLLFTIRSLKDYCVHVMTWLREKVSGSPTGAAAAGTRH